MIISIAWGASVGLTSGLISSFFVEKARLEKSTAVFMKTWGVAMACRFALVVSVLAVVWKVNAEHPMAVLLPLVLAQTAVQLFKPARTWALKK